MWTSECLKINMITVSDIEYYEYVLGLEESRQDLALFSLHELSMSLNNVHTYVYLKRSDLLKAKWQLPCTWFIMAIFRSNISN